MGNLLNKGIKFWQSEFVLRFFFFTILLLNFVIIPVSKHSHSALFNILEKSFYVFIVLTGSLAMIKNKAFLYSVFSVTILSFIFWIFNSNQQLLVFDVIDGLFYSIFFAFLLVLILIRVFRGGVFTMERLEGSIAGFLLTANFFTALFVTASLVIGPGAFSIPDVDMESLNHFSLITITTVGYGDIAPVHTVVRSLSNLEAVIGQLYPAVLIARLISLKSPKEKSNHNS